VPMLRHGGEARIAKTDFKAPQIRQFPMKKPRLIVAALALVFISVAVSFTSAAPSGGPYGPVQLNYELPKAKRIFYVAPDGKTDAPGTNLEQPTTIDTAIAQVSTGDAIILRGGIYRTGDLKLSQGITLQPYANERPILKGTEVVKDWKSQRNGLWRTSWKKLFPAKPADWWRRERHGKETPLHLFNNDMVFIDGELLAAVGGEHELTPKSYYIDYANQQVYIATNPENRVVEITAHDSALTRTIGEAHGKPNDRRGPVIRGITFTQYAYRALEVEATEPEKLMDPALFGKEVVGTTLENVTISHCSRVAGYFRGDNLVIRNCLVSDCGTEGIYVISSADILLEKNIVTRTNRAERIQGYFASAVKIFNQSYRAVCRDNLIIDNPDASGVWYDVGEVDGIFVNNWVERTNDGFFYEISKNAICAGNVFVNCNRGIYILNSVNVQVYQNTFFNSVVKIERTERSAVGDHFGWHPSTGPDVEERHSHVLMNNLFTADETFTGPLIDFKQASLLKDRLKDPQVSQLDGNVYVRRGSARPQPLITWSPTDTKDGTTDFAGLDEMRQKFPQFEAKSQTFADYWGPLFRSPELGHFELTHAFAGSSNGVALPKNVRSLLELKPETLAFPGATIPLK
jgi:parallel beta-helix repeat protein